MSEDKRARALAKVIEDMARRQDKKAFYGDPDILERLFKIENDDDVIAMHTRQLGGCMRCDRALYDFTDR